MTVITRPITHKDFAAWLPLWDGNNLGHRDQVITAKTWSRLNDKNSPVHGLLAQNDTGQITGLLHYITHPTTGAINDVCYMQDVYVDPAFRGQGIAKNMIGYLEEESAKQSWARIYWLAEANNTAAQALYKHIGLKLDFTFHVMLSPTR